MKGCAEDSPESAICASAKSSEASCRDPSKAHTGRGPHGNEVWSDGLITDDQPSSTTERLTILAIVEDLWPQTLTLIAEESIEKFSWAELLWGISLSGRAASPTRSVVGDDGEPSPRSSRLKTFAPIEWHLRFHNDPVFRENVEKNGSIAARSRRCPCCIPKSKSTMTPIYNYSHCSSDLVYSLAFCSPSSN